MKNPVGLIRPDGFKNPDGIEKYRNIMSRQFFGTDGVRGRVGLEPMTAPTVMKLGWAVGQVFA